MKLITDFFIRHFSFWPHLTEGQRAFLNDHTRPVRYAKGMAVQREMGDCLGVLLVKTGQLRAYALSEDGRDVTLHRLGSDEVSVMTIEFVTEGNMYKKGKALYLVYDEGELEGLENCKIRLKVADDAVHMKSIPRRCVSTNRKGWSHPSVRAGTPVCTRRPTSIGSSSSTS